MGEGFGELQQHPGFLKYPRAIVFITGRQNKFFEPPLGLPADQ
jgi:hypothetical protein